MSPIPKYKNIEIISFLQNVKIDSRMILKQSQLGLCAKTSGDGGKNA